MMVEISSGPVTAVTVTIDVISVPELVMNSLLPLMVHVPLSNVARVWVPPASEPAPGSVRPNAAKCSASARLGSHCCFCSSDRKSTRLNSIHVSISTASHSICPPSLHDALPICNHRRDICTRVGDEFFIAVNGPRSVVQRCPGLGAAGIRTSTRFSEAERRQMLGLGQAWQPLLLLFF